jgi:hypothetical protein
LSNIIRIGDTKYTFEIHCKAWDFVDIAMTLNCSEGVKVQRMEILIFCKNRWM